MSMSHCEWMQPTNPSTTKQSTVSTDDNDKETQETTTDAGPTLVGPAVSNRALDLLMQFSPNSRTVAQQMVIPEAQPIEINNNKDNDYQPNSFSIFDRQFVNDYPNQIDPPQLQFPIAQETDPTHNFSAYVSGTQNSAEYTDPFLQAVFEQNLIPAPQDSMWSSPIFDFHPQSSAFGDGGSYSMLSL